MKSTDLYFSFNEVDDDILERSERSAAHKVIPLRRRLVMAVAAVLVVVVLMGAAAVVSYWDNIQTWFAYEFELRNNQELSEGHKDLIEHLSQEIGISKTSNDVTITVDSAVVAEDSFKIMLVAEGIKNTVDYGLHDDGVVLTINGENKNTTVSGNFVGENTFVIILTGDIRDLEENVENVDVSLSMKGFLKYYLDYYRTNTETLEGEWYFEFSMNCVDTKTKVIKNVEAIVYDEQTGELTHITLDKVELTNMYLYFEYDAGEEWRYSVDTLGEDYYGVCAVLESGQEVTIDSGHGSPLGDESDTRICEIFYWKIPINIDEVVEIRIGDTVIPVK
ncbi:MAG: DUF4179 domain-containing protein [Oscillospiraceae bacterium]|nr:DUF4179 domain-containing protein [Oscillospiraceae bacterium]